MGFQKNDVYNGKLNKPQTPTNTPADYQVLQGGKNQIRKLQLRMKTGTAPDRGGELADGFFIPIEEE